MAFQQGLSGLNAASKNLEVIGNNVANANTVGFKQSQAQFADVFASSMNGSGASQVGIGTQVAAVAQQYTQGNISSSNNPLDMAINGAGFFRMSDNGAVTYTRNGQFHLDKTGYIVNSSGLRLTGYGADANGTISSGAPVDIKINTADKAPSTTAKAGLVLNLDSRSVVRVPAVAFSATDPTTYDHTTSTGVYDSLGNPHTLQTFYVKTAPNSWDVFATNDGVSIGAGSIGQLNFQGDGSLTAATTPLSVSVAVTSGANTPFTVTVDYKSTTQFGSDFGVNAMTQDGYASGKLSGFSAGADGKITGRYTNGQTATLGQIVLSNFSNPNGLASLGNNQWAETATSGPALVGTAGSGGLGAMQSSATEDSNVDLTAELVNMITAQRLYQANAQTIKTQDQVMQTLVNLR